MAIDVGAECIDRIYSTIGPKTVVNKENPANATGTIDSVCVHADTDVAGIEFASFVDEGSNILSTNGDTNGSNLSALADTPTTFNSPGDFTAFAINAGEYLGVYYFSGYMDYVNAGFAGFWRINNDAIPASSVAFAFYSGDAMSLYATGTEAGGVTMPIFMSNHLRQMGA